ncbi:hypothetical protein EVG20_g10219 [Dentipellis fragilis]|uniref:Integrase catalytic domain-containing protein n=1 Tax=Dentipellis fragilis TaxID=205917 RepID=A0A4Y9XSW2_9AGAM|nr:hypothetical protein EVG20_g10219 [Dentipellis fragilis]
MPLAVYLLTVQKFGGIPVQTVSDKGTETSKLAAVQCALRETFQPYLPSDTLPPHVFVKSVYNITRERAWRPLWAQDLANILFRYETGKFDAGYQPENSIHAGVAYWLWGKIVQEHLDVVVKEKNTHKIRYQCRVTMPTGGRPEDFYRRPQKWHGHDLLIPIPADTIDRLVAEHVRPELFQFGTDEIVNLSSYLYEQLRRPTTTLNNGWSVFRAMMDLYEASNLA